MHASYYISDDAWTWFKGSKKTTIRRFIEDHYHEWTTAELCIRDTALRELWDIRIAQGDGDYRDAVMYRAMYTEHGGRFPRTLDLSSECVGALAEAAVRWKLPRKFVTVNIVGLAALSLEMVGREWVC